MRELTKNDFAMSKYLIKIIVSICTVILTILAIIIASVSIHNLREENDRLHSNQELLMTENRILLKESQRYKAQDSLNAVRVSELELTLSEYKRYRSDDLKLIKSLKAKTNDLQGVISSQYVTITNLQDKLRDSIRIDTIRMTVDTLKCFNYKSTWTDVVGCINKADSIDMQIHNRESLKIVETVTYKRFLGFLWKTCKVKSRQVDVVSENPNTEITNFEYILIKQ